jgi:methylphosphotriester-DNA--protein-cysteine methyltransferase
MDTLPTQERLTSAGEEKLCKRWHQFAEDSHFDARKMAGLCQVSVRHLGRIVKQEAGVTPRKWLRLRRMRVALSCLREYEAAGITQFLFMGWPGLEEMRHFSDGARPCLGDSQSSPTSERPPAAMLK